MRPASTIGKMISAILVSAFRDAGRFIDKAQPFLFQSTPEDVANPGVHSQANRKKGLWFPAARRQSTRAPRPVSTETVKRTFTETLLLLLRHITLPNTEHFPPPNSTAHTLPHATLVEYGPLLPNLPVTPSDPFFLTPPVASKQLQGCSLAVD